MNDIIRDLMRRPRFIEEVRLGLPAAFQKAEVAHRRPRSNVTGQEVGITRESIMLALLRHQLGDSQIEFPDGQTSQQDVLIRRPAVGSQDCHRQRPGDRSMDG